MRQVRRLSLSDTTEAYLASRQQEVDEKAGTEQQIQEVQRLWKRKVDTVAGRAAFTEIEARDC